MSVNEEDIVAVPHKYDKFVHNNGMPYAYLEVPITFLSEELPTDATWSASEVDDNGNSTKQKTIEEYVIWKQKSNDETKAVIGLMGTIAPTYRVRMFGKNDLQDWETWLDTKGYSIDNFLTIEERNTLLESEDYE
tara:strand:- start:1473 stop:1877 length:405 start_codon:yes stop_codon:yes gene_type:complete